MIWHLIRHGYIAVAPLVATVIGCVLIVAVSFILNRLRVIISLSRFLVLIAAVIFLCLVLPPAWWLGVMLIAISIFLFSGLMLGWLCNHYKFLNLYVYWQNGKTPCFVGQTNRFYLKRELSDSGNYLLNHLKSFLVNSGELVVEGIDSNHYRSVTQFQKLHLPEKENMESVSSVDVIYTLRGCDTDTTLFLVYQLPFPWSLLVPWQKRKKISIPEKDVLSSGFATFAGVNLAKKRESSEKKIIRRESRFQSDHFLHISDYQPGEPLTRIDFKSSQRVNQLVSRKYAEAIDLRCLVAVGLGKRAMASQAADNIMDHLGKILTENSSAQINSDLVVFDLGIIREWRLDYNVQKILGAARDLSLMNASRYEEDELAVLDMLGQRIGDYSHLRLIVAWGGRFDVSRALELAEIFIRKHVKVEISVVATDVLETLEKNSDTDSALFFSEIMTDTVNKARKIGVNLNWVK